MHAHGVNVTDDALVADATLARFRADGTAWAYELAERIVLHCRFLELFDARMHLPMGVAAAWYSIIRMWDDATVAEVDAWRERCPPRSTTPTTPAAVVILLDQARKLLGL